VPHAFAPRKAVCKRQTQETHVDLALNLDGTGLTHIQTGLGFADHMLHLLAFWAEFDLDLSCTGDLHVDAHHSLEDIGLALGTALAEALGDKAGIARLGAALVPMDEALVEVVLDISGRPYLVYEDAVLPARIAGEEKDLWREFFKSLAQEARMNLHIHYRYGRNGHHLIEGACKAAGLALRQAVARSRQGIPSTKGSC
jgi:imidazoleglycerol-phosphate dehydratase